MATITYDRATRLFPGSDVPAVDQLDLHIEDGEFLVLVDRKSTRQNSSHPQQSRMPSSA